MRDGIAWQKRRFLGLLFGVSCFTSASSQAVSLIAGVPSAETTPAHTGMIAGEVQVPFRQPPAGSTYVAGFAFATFGLFKNFELASTLYNLALPGTQRIALSAGFKHVVPLASVWSDSATLERWEPKVLWGTEIPVSIQGGEGVGAWLFFGASLRVPNLKTRFTLGPSWGSRQIFGRETWMFFAGIEQPLNSQISIIADWMSGSTDLGGAIIALQWDPVHWFTMITGPKISNDESKTPTAWMVELTIELG